MNPRIKATLASAAVLAAAFAAFYFWGIVPALLVVFAAAAALVAARQFGAEAREASGESAHLSTAPNVASAVAAGDVPAAALLEVTMDSMREAVVIIDSAMRVVALNNSARGVFRAGGGDSALSPRRLSDLTRNPSVYSAFAAAVARGERAEVKVEIERRDARGTYDLHVAPLRQREAVYGSDVRGAVGVFFDITRLERLERVRQEFLSNVSHELRTPLTAIIAFVETLEDMGADDRENTARFLSVIRRN